MASIFKFSEKHDNARNRYPITNIDGLDINRYLYVRPDGITRDIDQYKEKFGDENVITIPKIPTGHESKFLVKYQTVIEHDPVTQNSHVIAYFESMDFSNIEQDRIREFLIQLRFKTYIPTSNQPDKDERIKTVFFDDCELPEITDTDQKKNGIVVLSGSQNLLPNLYFVNCDIKKFVIGHPKKAIIDLTRFWACRFERVDQIDRRAECTIESTEIKIIETAAKKLSISNITLRLIHHKNIDTSTIETDNVTIKYDKNILRKINDDQIRGYLNTYYQLQSKASLVSEKNEIARYINYFESKLVPMKSFLFKLHGGFTKMLAPLIWTIVLLVSNLLILEFYSTYSGEILTSTVYPIDLLRNYIFADFSFQNDLSLTKTIVFLVEISFIYMLFSFISAIRKFYGFKIPK